MRRLRRPAISLPTLIGDGKGSLQATENLRTRASDPVVALSFPDHWNASDVRGALYAMHGRVCAYCQGDLPHNDPGDVEHFRPKSVYWWLAYEFANYLLSCAKCNRVCKRKEFPLPRGVAPWVWEKRDQIQEEQILLLDPVVDDVEAWFRVERRDDVLFFLAPVAGYGADFNIGMRIKTTIRFFRLNSPFLIKQRSRTIYRALQALDQALGGDDLRAQEVRQMASRFHPHGTAIRQILTERAPELIPSPEEELLHLVMDLIYELKLADASLAQSRGNPSDLRFRAEILWALAVLWKDPPAGSSHLVKSLLVKAKRWDEVNGLIQNWANSFA